MKNKKELLEGLDNIRDILEQSRLQYEHENEAWWNSLSEKEREDAFYAVCKRIHKADLVDRGTYRSALYDVFGFDMSMYGRGMDCGYMEIHNAIYEGDINSVTPADLLVTDSSITMRQITRFEVGE